MAVDVATDLMEKKGITAKFTTDELRDNYDLSAKVRHKGAKLHLPQPRLKSAVEWGHHIHRSACDSPTGVSGGSATHSS